MKTGKLLIMKLKSTSVKYTLLLLVLFVSFGQLQSRENIKWYPFDEGLKLSANINKPVLIFFYSDLCAYCNKMEDESFSDGKIVSRLNKSYVPVKLNVDIESKSIKYNNRMISSRDLFFMFNGSVLPFIVFLEGGSIITSVPGFLEKRIFQPLLEYINVRCYDKKVSFEDYINKRDLCKGT